jgi:hypothetical protein
MWRHKKKCELSTPQMLNEDTIRDILKTIAVSHQQNEDFKKQNIKIILYNNRSLVDKANFDIIV